MVDDKASSTWTLPPEPDLDLVTARIDERLTALGLSDREASIRATGRPDAVREIRRAKRPGAKRLIQLARALETSPDYLAGYTNDADRIVRLTMNESTEVALPLSGATPLPRDIPVYGAAPGETISFEFDRLARRDGSISEDAPPIETLIYDLENPIDFARRPPRLTGRTDIYAVVVFGTSMYPRFREGDYLYIDPRLPPRVGDDAFVLFKSRFAQPDSVVFLKEMAARVTERAEDGTVEQLWKLRQFNRPATCTIAYADGEAHRVIPWNELFSL